MGLRCREKGTPQQGWNLDNEGEYPRESRPIPERLKELRSRRLSLILYETVEGDLIFGPQNLRFVESSTLIITGSYQSNI